MTDTPGLWTIRADDAEDALCLGLEMIIARGDREASRAGPVLVAPCPAVTITMHPRRHVIRAPWRDANPFFHLIEAAWMLAGRDDAASLTPYVKRFAEYAEPSGVVHGAYGRRWRAALGVDQLDAVVTRLRQDPGTRQCVLQMWDGTSDEDEFRGAADLTGDWRDRPCNTHAYVRMRRVVVDEMPNSSSFGPDHENVLDLTVLCRSNDLIWGAHGANAVHFAVLQEYLARRVGCRMGILRQFSNNYHAYITEVERLQKREGFLSQTHHNVEDPHPLFEPGDIEADLPRLWAFLDEVHRGAIAAPLDVSTPFALTVATAAAAHAMWRASGDALRAAAYVSSNMVLTDWALACAEWLTRRARA